MIKGFKIIIGLTALIVIGILIGASVLLPKREFRKDISIIAYGDSLTRGFGIPPGKNFVTILSEHTNIPIINAGVTGDTTSEALIRLQTEILDKKPDIVMVCLGGNDFLHGLSEDVIYANLKTIIEKIQGGGAKVILLGISSENLPNFEKTFQKLASEKKVYVYVPNIMDGVLSQKNFLFDNIHPNGRGHELIAQKILPFLQKAIWETGK
ncbi:MAG: GDSL-type esterase/lipase family protein [Candidatus Pacebacteria bacterium]|nr:GDSL-type esterase/lipase family protein [Candidatus Paceibacterota bacterium]